MLGAERQRKMLGCSDTECVSELTAALGVQAVVIADVAKLERTYALNVKVIANDATTLAAFNERAADQDSMPSTVSRAAWSLTSQLSRVWEGLTPGDEPRTARTSRLWSLLPMALGVAGITTGVVLELKAAEDFRSIQTAPTADLVSRAAERGRTNEALATTSLIVGSACLITAGLLALLLGDSPLTPVAWLSPYASGFSLVGVLP